jgi:hypothetical protein
MWKAIASRAIFQAWQSILNARAIRLNSPSSSSIIATGEVTDDITPHSPDEA